MKSNECKKLINVDHLIITAKDYLEKQEYSKSEYLTQIILMNSFLELSKQIKCFHIQLMIYCNTANHSKFNMLLGNVLKLVNGGNLKSACKESIKLVVKMLCIAADFLNKNLFFSIYLFFTANKIFNKNQVDDYICLQYIENKYLELMKQVN